MLAPSPGSPVMHSQVLLVTEPVGTDADGRTYYSSVQTVRLDEYSSVLLDEGAPQTIMQLSVIWSQTGMAPQGEFRRLWRPEDTFEGRKPYHGERELLISNELLVLPLHQISVESFSTFCHRQHFSQGVYYFTSSEYYDAQAGRVLTKPSQLLFVSTLRQQLNSLASTLRKPVALYVGPTPPAVPATQLATSPPASPAVLPTPSMSMSPQPQAVAQEHRDASPPVQHIPAAVVYSATPDIPNAPGMEADDSPGASEEEKARSTSHSSSNSEEEKSKVVTVSRFGGPMVPVAELSKLHQEQAEAEKRAYELMHKLKRRADALDVVLGSPAQVSNEVLSPGVLLRLSASSSVSKKPRSPQKRAKPKPKVARTPLKFELVK